MELTFDSGEAVIIDVAGDWTLVARQGPWVDDLVEPLDDDKEFVLTHAKWSAEDLSPSLAEALIGARIQSASLLHNEMNEVDGVRLVTQLASVVDHNGVASCRSRSSEAKPESTVDLAVTAG